MALLAQDAAFQRVALLPRHARHVERIRGLRLVGWLLELTAVDELDINDRCSSRFSGIFVLKPAAQSGYNGRKIIVERGCRASRTLIRSPRSAAGRLSSLDVAVSASPRRLARDLVRTSLIVVSARAPCVEEHP
jgi:hypothetical protein